MRWPWTRRQPAPTISEKDRIEGLKAMATPPVRTYLVALMDHLVRQGLYLPPAKQEAAKFLIETLTSEIGKGEKLLRK